MQWEHSKHAWLVIFGMTSESNMNMTGQPDLSIVINSSLRVFTFGLARYF